MTLAQWKAFKSQTYTFPASAKVKTNPYAFAATVLTNQGYKQTIGTDLFSIQIGEARQALLTAFTTKYGANHQFVTGASNVKGSLAQITKQLLAYPSLTPTTDINGTATVLPTYITDPTKFSSDYDPYSDGREVSKVNDNPLVTSPADHPLIAGFPIIQGELTGYQVTLDREITNSSSQNVANSWSGEFSSTTEVMHGWHASVSVETGMKFIFPEMTVTAEAGYEGSVTNSTTTTFGQESSREFSFGEDITYSTACPARVKFNLDIVNNGTAPAENIVPRINIYMGAKTPAYTYVPAMGDLHLGDLSPGQRKSYAFPLVGDADICVSMETLQYLESGGAIKVDVDVQQANIAFFDEQLGRVVTDGDWTDYVRVIQHEAAGVEFSLQDTQGYAHKGVYLVYAGQTPRLTLRDAIGLGLSLPTCNVNDNGGSCIDDKGTVSLDNNTFLGIYAYDALGRRLDNAQTTAAINSALAGSANILDVRLNPRWKYHLTTPTQTGAKYLYTKVRKAATEYKIELHASDVLGLKSVAFCSGDTMDTCSAMQFDASLSTAGNMVFKHAVALTYITTGKEKFRVFNTRDELAIFPMQVAAYGDPAKLNPYIQRANRHMQTVDTYMGLPPVIKTRAESFLGMVTFATIKSKIQQVLNELSSGQAICGDVLRRGFCEAAIENAISYANNNRYAIQECDPRGLIVYLGYGSSSEMHCESDPWRF